TRYNLKLAASDSPEARKRGIQRIRAAGSESALLRACYYSIERPTDLIGTLLTLGNPVTTAQAQQVYYRVTGNRFDSVPQPEQSSQIWLRRNHDDFQRRGEPVAGTLPGLSLAVSQIDGSIDSEAAIGYLEWTMVFKNSEIWQQEARTQVLLPPGG